MRRASNAPTAGTLMRWSTAVRMRIPRAVFGANEPAKWADAPSLPCSFEQLVAFKDVEAYCPDVDRVTTPTKDRRALDHGRLESITEEPVRERRAGNAGAGYKDA
jgi:hypothetical protein